MIRVPLTKNKYAIIDDADLKLVSKHKWHFDRYAVTNVAGNKVYMHRLIVNTPTGLDTDHINRNKLDNRKCNLRVCDRSTNRLNVGLTSRNTTGHKGVYFDRKKNLFSAYITKNYKQTHLGYYPTKYLASLARKKAEVNYG